MTPIDFYHIVRNCVRLSVEMIDMPEVFVAPDYVTMCDARKFRWKEIVVNYYEIIRLMKPFFRWMPVNTYTWFDHYATNCDNHEIILSSDIFNQFISVFSLCSSGEIDFGPFVGSSNHDAALQFVVGVINAGSFVINDDTYAMIRILALSSDQAVTNYFDEVQRSAIEMLNSKQQSGDNDALLGFYEFLPKCDADDEKKLWAFVPSASQLELLEESLKREVVFVTQLRWSLPSEAVKEVQPSHVTAQNAIEDSPESSSIGQESPMCPLAIDSKMRKASIDGVAIEGQLTPEQIKVLETLIQHWPNRLSKDELSDIKGVGDPLGVFKRLIEREPWDRLFSSAGRERNKYGWRPELLK